MYKRKNLCNEYAMIYCHPVYEKGLTRSDVIKFLQEESAGIMHQWKVQME